MYAGSNQPDNVFVMYFAMHAETLAYTLDTAEAQHFVGQLDGRYSLLALADKLGMHAAAHRGGNHDAPWAACRRRPGGNW